MKVVLFCGGLGIRLREYSDRIPKPMAEVGSRPLLWHLMQYYAHYGHKDFILCLGYGGDLIKRYFLDYSANDFVLSAGDRDVTPLGPDMQDWRISFIDTGLHSSAGERLRLVRDHLDGDDMFLANYADGLSDLDLRTHVDSFAAGDALACLLRVAVPHGFHVVETDGEGRVLKIDPISASPVRINGGFFVMRSGIFEHLEPGEDLIEPLQRLTGRRQLLARSHDGFWQCLDTLKDKLRLDELAATPPAPWQVWLRRDRR